MVVNIRARMKVHDDEEYDDEEYDDEDSDGEEYDDEDSDGEEYDDEEYEDSADDEYEEESSEGDTEYEDDEGVDEEYENDVNTDDGSESNEENSAVDDYQDDGSDVAADDQAEESASQNAASTKRKLAAGSSGTNRKLQSSTNRKRRSGLAEINFDFTLLKKQGDSSVTIDDGDILYDMDGAESGDKFKVNFSTDCKCYVYIVGIDTTGFVATIFPDEESNAFNPAVPDKQYELPAGNTWWGLDTNRGVETIYLIISREQRDDIDALLLSLSEMPATESRSADGPTIKQTMIAEMRRGLKKVKVNVQNSSGIRSSVDRYVARLKDVDADVVVSRWFEHQ